MKYMYSRLVPLNLYLLDLVYGGPNIWMWGVRSQQVRDLGGESLGCVNVESPHNPNSASMIGGFDTYMYSLSGSIVSTLLVGLDLDAHSLCNLYHL